MQNTAAVLTKLNTIELQQVPMPTLKPGDVMIKLAVVGICGSDIHYYTQGRIGNFVVEFPFILGHEASGTVVEVAPDVTNIKVGDRVCIEPGVPCGKCSFCMRGHYNLCPDVEFLATPPYNGCLMNYITYPASWTYKLPDSMSLDEGALVEPLAIGINAAKTGKVRLGDTVLVYGAGCIGLVSAMAAKAFGATRVIVVDLIEKRLEIARKYGAITLNSEQKNIETEILDLTGGKGVDVVLDCVGLSQTIRGAVMAAKSGGRIVIVGMATEEINSVPLGPISTKELLITSIFRYANLFPATIEAIAGRTIDVKSIISNRYPFAEVIRAYSETVKNIRNTVKSVIIFPDESL